MNGLWMLAVFISGFFLCYLCFVVPLTRLKPGEKETSQTILVKRAKPSLRNPMRTYNVAYDEFKSTKGLFEPVKPKEKAKKDEIEVGR